MTPQGADAQRQRAVLFRRFHRDDRLLTLINVWDVASALVVAQNPKCTAVATASASIAAAFGYDDGEQIPRDLAMAVLARISAAVDMPVSADLERGYGDVAGTVAAALDAGAVGVNIEDGMTDTDTMRQRIIDAVGAGREKGIPLVVNARTDVYLLQPDWVPHRQQAEAAERGRRYLDAGADCVFVPGCVDPEHIRGLSAEFGPRRLSLLVVPGLPDVRDLQRWGVARVSHGPYPHRHTLAALAQYSGNHQ